jgi:GSH-dependent disulfide-bond oxidoreductase
MIDMYVWGTDNGNKARLVIEESGLEHRIKPVNLQKKEQLTPDFIKISPAHKIPAMVDHDGPGGKPLTLCESGAILKYVAEKSGKLYPKDPLARVKCDQWLFFASSSFTPIAQQFSLFLFRFGQDVPPAKKHYEEKYRELLGFYETHFASNRYLVGDEYSVADIATFPDVHQHDRLGVKLDGMPNLKRWVDAIAARPAVAKALTPMH